MMSQLIVDISKSEIKTCFLFVTRFPILLLFSIGLDECLGCIIVRAQIRLFQI